MSLREADKNTLRFQREVRIMSRLHSDNLPRIIDGGLDGDQPYLAMEYVPGMTLADLIAKEDRLRVAWAAAIGAQIAAGLAVAHRASVVHRDLKPSNVMITPDGRGEGTGLRGGADPRRCRRRTADQLRRDDRYGAVHVAGAGQGGGDHSRH